MEEMMQLKVYQEKEKEQEQEQPMYLKLREVSVREKDSIIQLLVCNEDGDPIGLLLAISPKGLYRYKHLREALGFPLDEDGRIKLDEGQKEGTHED
jgi:hypothetical protein